MTSYRVLSGASAKSLEDQVVDLMQDGYEPIGGVSVTEAGSRMIESALRGGGMIHQVELLFSQAMLQRLEQIEPAESVEKPEKSAWVKMRIEKDYDQYWSDEKKRFVITDQHDGGEVEVWEPTLEELTADLERSYDFEFKT